MAHHQKLRTEDFDERGRNQYEHNDSRGGRQGDTYEQRNYGHSREGESGRSSYASSGRIGAYGQNNQGRNQGDQTHPGQDQHREQDYRNNRSRYEDEDDRRRTSGNFDQDQGRSYGRAAQQRGEFQYYTRDNDQFRGYPDDNDRRQYATRQDDAPSYVHFQHQRPGGITPRDYNQDDARVRGNEASRGRDQYSRGFSDRGHSPYGSDYGQDNRGGNNERSGYEDRRGYSGYEDRDDRRGDRDDRNSRQEFGYGNDYSSSLYDDNSRNRTNRTHDNRDERRPNDDDRNRNQGRGYNDTNDRGRQR
ncbi:hypothetical protein [Solirubrum puertoriconensis]|uniref:Uncharacterized protein n=1 Tax=Solirubrum puertoriconensis TaxID=1751427 RepID=A0A9X0HK81_SOLP1|nr:hypothetical protein [Solirubrum puertoriconensis]KUG07341.1 hypothetical protein ASU33_13365 [Solirubrum puertoriconensis]